MANISNPPMAVVASLFIVTFLLLSPHYAEAQVGVCNGRNGDNLPSPQDVIKLYQSQGIKAMRLYDPNQDTLNALQGSGITLILDVPNDQVQALADDQSATMQWVETNVVPYASSIKYIAVGNEIEPSTPLANSVQNAMKNVHDALDAKQLAAQIKVSTSIKMNLIMNSSPPSQGQFGDMNYITPIVNFLTSNDSPLLLNVYPYFAYKDDKRIPLDYALFKATNPVVTDNNLNYDNLFDAMVDSVYAALSKAGAPNTKIVVSETGWPSEGEASATMENAGTYYQNVVSHVDKGTPLKPGQDLLKHTCLQCLTRITNKEMKLSVILGSLLLTKILNMVKSTSVDTLFFL